MSKSDTSVSYSIQQVGDKDYGIVARVPIPKGTRILSESPLFRVPHKSNSKECISSSMSSLIAALQEDQRQAFFALYNAFEDEDGPDLGRIRTNALPLGHDAVTGGIFLESSRINHSCDPNAQNTWNGNIQKLTIHAIRDIAKDEEITICYLDARRNHRDRQQHLRNKFRFTCSCSLCSLPAHLRDSSDERWDEIHSLDTSIGDGITILFSPTQALLDVKKILKLLDAEGFSEGSVPRAYYDAFQIAVTHGDVARASVFATRAHATRLILEGNDSPVVQKMEALARDPSKHMAYNPSGSWRTTKDDIPEQLDQQDFERWLWREEVTTDLQQYADLRRETDFPSFNSLPGENDLDLRFLATNDGFTYRPRKHWCFLAEITAIETFLRLRLFVKDKEDQEVTIAFHTDGRGAELASASLQTGYTVAMLYAEQHWFMDMSIGIRHEHPTTLKIFHLSLSRLLALGDKVQQYATERGDKRTCHGCGDRAATLQKCSRCGLFWYCNRTCQTVAWNEKGHKADCKSLRDGDLHGLFLTKWNSFGGFLQFPLTVKGR